MLQAGCIGPVSKPSTVCAGRPVLMQASFRAAEEEQRQVIAKHGHELSMEALNDMKVGGRQAPTLSCG